MTAEALLRQDRMLADACTADPGLWNLVQAEREWALYGDACDPLSPAAPEHRLKLLQQDVYLELWEQPLSQLLPEARVMLAGGGTGRFAAPLLDRSLRVELVDASPHAVARARHHLGDVCTVRVADLNLPDALARGAYDVVFAVEVACYVTEPARVMHHLAASLKPGGTLLFSVESGIGALLGDRDLASPAAVAAVLDRGRITLPGRKHVHYYDRQGAAALARDAGLTVHSVDGVCYVPDGPFQAHIDVSRLDDRTYREEIVALERRCREHPVLRELPRAWAVTATA